MVHVGGNQSIFHSHIYVSLSLKSIIKYPWVRIKHSLENNKQLPWAKKLDTAGWLSYKVFNKVPIKVLTMAAVSCSIILRLKCKIVNFLIHKFVGKI